MERAHSIVVSKIESSYKKAECLEIGSYSCICGLLTHYNGDMAFLQCKMEDQPDIAAAIMTQLSMKAGLKACGKGTEKAVKQK